MSYNFCCHELYSVTEFEDEKYMYSDIKES